MVGKENTPMNIADPDYDPPNQVPQPEQQQNPKPAQQLEQQAKGVPGNNPDLIPGLPLPHIVEMLIIEIFVAAIQRLISRIRKED